MTGAGTLLLPSPPPPNSPVPSTPSLLQPDPRAAISPYPSPTEPSNPGALLHPSLPTCLPGGPGAASPSLLLLPTPCLPGGHASPGNRASFMATISLKHIKFV